MHESAQNAECANLRRAFGAFKISRRDFSLVCFAILQYHIIGKRIDTSNDWLDFSTEKKVY